MYYDMKQYKLKGFRKSHSQNKKYDAILQNNNKLTFIPFGDNRYENYHDKTKLNLYPHLLHGDKVRRASYKARHKKDIKKGYYSPGYFSYYKLW
jgi:hypothetical protein